MLGNLPGSIANPPSSCIPLPTTAGLAHCGQCTALRADLQEVRGGMCPEDRACAKERLQRENLHGASVSGLVLSGHCLRWALSSWLGPEGLKAILWKRIAKISTADSDVCCFPVEADSQGSGLQVCDSPTQERGQGGFHVSSENM